VGQLAVRSGIAVSALHFYEEQGLISARRTTGNQRRADLDERISQLPRLRDGLTDCIGCGCLSLRACRVVNPDDALGGDGPGARNL
jgi:MerR family transcriptional regulator, redox-sensitive transcriptional activator SoxR